MWLPWSTLCLNVPNVQESLMAGIDASATTIEWALVELLKHPKVMKKAQDELDGVVGDGRFVNENDIPQLKYLQAIMKETFRLHPPAPLLVPHESIESCEINGYHVPAKTHIFVNIWAIHRNLCAYENPLDLNLERFVGSEVDLKGFDFPTATIWFWATNVPSFVIRFDHCANGISYASS
jgi:flavonoid 3'-monooxygenase